MSVLVGHCSKPIEWVPPGAGAVCAKCGGHPGDCHQWRDCGEWLCLGCWGVITGILREIADAEWQPLSTHPGLLRKEKVILRRWLAGEDVSPKPRWKKEEQASGLLAYMPLGQQMPTPRRRLAAWLFGRSR